VPSSYLCAPPRRCSVRSDSVRLRLTLIVAQVPVGRGSFPRCIPRGRKGPHRSRPRDQCRAQSSGRARGAGMERLRELVVVLGRRVEAAGSSSCSMIIPFRSRVSRVVVRYIHRSFVPMSHPRSSRFGLAFLRSLDFPSFCDERAPRPSLCGGGRSRSKRQRGLEPQVTCGRWRGTACKFPDTSHYQKISEKQRPT